MEKRLGKKVYRKMPTMQVMTGYLLHIVELSIRLLHY